MKERNLDNIIFNKVGAKKIADRTNHSKPVKAFDTETFKGECVLLGVWGDTSSSKKQTKDYLIPNSIDDILHFLTLRKYTLSHNFFFNLKYDRDALIKMLPDKNINELKAYNNTYYNGFILTIIGNKAFQISRTKEVINKDGEKKSQKLFTSHFSDIASYYKYGTLENTVEKALKIKYKKSIDIGEGVPKEDLTKEIIDYCLDDCYYTYLISKNIVELADEFVYVNKFFSPASISKAFMRSNFKSGYKFTPNKLQQYALYSYNGGRFEVLQKGYFDDVYSADINSAYPYQLSKLYYPEGVIKTTLDYEPDSIYSFFKCNIKISEDFILSPFKYILKKMGDLLVFPTGEFKEVYITKQDYEIMYNLDCKIEIIKGIHLFNKEPRLWLDGIVDMYYKRRELKKIEDKKEYILKLILNSLYGITIQLSKTKKVCDTWNLEDDLNFDNELVDFDAGLKMIKHDWMAGAWFNPVIATEVTAHTRNQIFNDFSKYEKDIIMIATDSITTTRKIHIKNTKNIGEYEHYPNMFGVVLANGIYEFREKKNPDNIVTTGKRTILMDKFICSRCKKTYSRNVLTCNCGSKIVKNDLSLIDLFKNNYSKTLSLTKTRPKGLKEGLPSNFESFNPNNLINIFIPFQKELSINIDKKRMWEHEFTNFNAILKDQIISTPLNSKNIN